MSSGSSRSSFEEATDLQPATTNEPAMNGTCQCSKYRDLPHRSSNETLKMHSNFAVKLSETAVEFIQKLALAEEQHSQHLRGIVKAFKKKTVESFTKDPLMCGTGYFKAWEAMLEESDRQARSHTDISQRFLTSVSQHLSDLTTRKKHLMKKWYAFREVYMSRIDKTEDNVQRMFREYQDHWTRYAEGLERGEGSVKDGMVLRSYNAHNDYVLSRVSFNSLHEEFYNKQVYGMLDELQAIQEDLVKGFAQSLKNRVEIQQDKLKDSVKHLSNLMESISAISPPVDIAHFVGGQNIQVKTYPPPSADHKTPELPTPKLPDTPPVNLAPLPAILQLVDLTQAPLFNNRDELKRKEVETTAGLDQLHKEYQSVKTLLSSYRENASLGDPNSLVEELLQIRNKVRIKEADLAMIKGKLSTFDNFSADGASPDTSDMYDLLENCGSSFGMDQLPRRTSEILVVGRSHEFVEDERKFRIPVFCSYCDGMLQPPISRGVKCKICKVTVHTKCQHLIPYCSGQAPVKKAAANLNPPKSAQPKSSPKFMPKVQKRFSWMLQKKTHSSASSDSIEDEDDETLGGLYEVPPLPPPKPGPSEKRRVISPIHAPQPPPRGESLDPRQSLVEEALTHHSFEDTLELVDSFSQCVALFDYSKVNPNDMELQAGEVIELINTFSSDWWKGSSRDDGDKKGYFPASYVQPVSHGEAVVKALYDFAPSSDQEMALEPGQIVVMIRNEGDGWLLGKSGDVEGVFPENYVEKLCVV